MVHFLRFDLVKYIYGVFVYHNAIVRYDLNPVSVEYLLLHRPMLASSTALLMSFEKMWTGNCPWSLHLYKRSYSLRYKAIFELVSLVCSPLLKTTVTHLHIWLQGLMMSGGWKFLWAIFQPNANEVYVNFKVQFWFCFIHSRTLGAFVFCLNIYIAIGGTCTKLLWQCYGFHTSCYDHTYTYYWGRIAVMCFVTSYLNWHILVLEIVNMQHNRT